MNSFTSSQIETINCLKQWRDGDGGGNPEICAPRSQLGAMRHAIQYIEKHCQIPPWIEGKMTEIHLRNNELLWELNGVVVPCTFGKNWAL